MDSKLKGDVPGVCGQIYEAAITEPGPPNGMESILDAERAVLAVFRPLKPKRRSGRQNEHRKVTR